MQLHAPACPLYTVASGGCAFRDFTNFRSSWLPSTNSDPTESSGSLTSFPDFPDFSLTRLSSVEGVLNTKLLPCSTRPGVVLPRPLVVRTQGKDRKKPSWRRRHLSLGWIFIYTHVGTLYLCQQQESMVHSRVLH